MIEPSAGAAVGVAATGVLAAPPLPAHQLHDSIILEPHVSHSWFLQLLFNLICYSLIVIPSGMLIYLVKSGKCPQNVLLNRFVQWFVYGISPLSHRQRLANGGFPPSGASEESIDLLESEAKQDGDESAGPAQEEFKITIERSHASRTSGGNPFDLKSVSTLLFCAAGLQIAYLTWGVLQEKIMTTVYQSDPHHQPGSEENKSDSIKFFDSQFLVFINRILAFKFALIGLYLVNRRKHSSALPADGSQVPPSSPPLYEFMYSSLSNILSSWCQYEALKFVNFPTQVLSKACKLIPVMIMSRIVSGKRYRMFEYLCAAGISCGMTLFLLGNHSAATPSTGTESESAFSAGLLSGIIILSLYLTFDSFTSNWQAALFERHPRLTSLEMMAATNFYSILLTLTSLVTQGALFPAIALLFSSGRLMSDCFLLSVCSAAGQMLVFYTIHRFGALVFVTIMTLRQAVAIPLSCLIFGHNLSAASLLGVLLVFGTLFTQIYLKYKFRPHKGRPKRGARTVSRT